MVVDDDPGVLELLDDMLAARRITPILCPTAEDALDELAGDRSIALLISDIQLPGMSGIQLAEQLKIQGRRIAVVLMTGAASETQISRARALGVHRVLRKPIDPIELFSALASAFCPR
jgi:CheY-like chemotaxis protein